MELVNNLSLNPYINSSADTPRNGLQRYAFFPYKPKPPLRTHLPHHTLLAVTFLLRLLCSPPLRFIQTKVKNTYSRRSRSEALPKSYRSPRRFSPVLPVPACHPPPPILPFGLIVLPLTCLTKIRLDHDLS